MRSPDRTDARSPTARPRMVALVCSIFALAACPASAERPPAITIGDARFDEGGGCVQLGAESVCIRLDAIGRVAPAPVAARVQPLPAGGGVDYARAPGVTEWWRPVAGGLEHGVTIRERPPGRGPLVLELAIVGLAPDEIRPEGAVLADARGAPVARYDGLVVLDARGERVPARLRRSRGLAIEVDDRAARYPLVVDPFVGAAEARLYLSPGTSDDAFGWSIAMSADGTRAIIGRPGANFETGAAHVYARSGSSWTLEQSFGGSMRDEYFGWSVALSADGSRAIIGAYRADTALGTNSGRAVVVVRMGTTWSTEAPLLPADASSGDFVGASVALSGDGTRALTGMPGANGDAGSARVWVRSGSTWTEETELVPTVPTTGGFLGAAVSLDATGTRALVGEPGLGFEDAGRALVFERSGSSWAESAVLAGDPSEDHFGGAVALSADSSRAIIGAVRPVYFGTSGFAGSSARVFARSGATWSEEAELVPSAGTIGSSVAISADGSGAVAGGPDRAHAFARSGTTWTEDAVRTRATTYDFGRAVALAGDGQRAAIGAPADTTPGGLDRGSVFVYADVGAACVSDADCASGHCADGVCCDSACDTLDCTACANALTDAPSGLCTRYSATVAPTIECRPAAGPCDRAETCSSTSFFCPADGFLGSATVCRPSAAACDAAERCSGTSPACPADAPSAAGTICRSSGGACDPAEVCDGVGTACPPPAVAPSGTECRASLGACDPAEVCDGASPACPPQALTPAGTECRAAVGPCDIAEACTGFNQFCPPDSPAPAGTPCRASAGACDVAELCTGLSTACPADGRSPAGTECRASTGACDVAEACDGVAADCPADAYAAAGTECRASAGACDVAESCDGLSASCPGDVLAPAGTECRPSSGCDAAEVCDGASLECPADVTECPDAGTDGGSMGSDGGVIGDAGVTVVDASVTVDGGLPDAARPDDAGAPDAMAGPDGGAAPVEAGCSCRTAPTAGRGWILAWLAVALLARRRRRQGWGCSDAAGFPRGARR